VHQLRAADGRTRESWAEVEVVRVTSPAIHLKTSYIDSDEVVAVDYNFRHYSLADES